MGAIKIGDKLYSFAQGAKELNLFTEEGVKKVSTSDLIEKYQSGDAETVKLFQNWVKEKTSTLLEIPEDKAKEITALSDLAEENEGLKDALNKFAEDLLEEKSQKEALNKTIESLKIENEKLKEEIKALKSKKPKEDPEANKTKPEGGE